MSKEFKDKNDLIESLKESLGDKFNLEAVEKYAQYCLRVKLEKDKQGNPRNKWFQRKTVEELDLLFRRVLKEGLFFDGVDITYISTGISYNYQAYKNKMLIAYPDSKIDLSVVYEGDEFSFEKTDGKINYYHKFANPFNHDESKIMGGYVVIKNKRGEFLTTLDKEEINKHRKVAKTDYIWRNWFTEMVMKTLIKKSCKYHFNDIYKGLEEMDNENYDLSKVNKKQSLEEERVVEKINAAKTQEDLDFIKQKAGEKYLPLIKEKQVEINKKNK